MKSRSIWRAVLTPALAAASAGAFVASLPHVWPTFEFSVLAQGAARIAALLTGSPLVQLDSGFALPAARVPVIVTTACSAADFCSIVAALVAWRMARHSRAPWLAIAAGCTAAVPLTVLVNALRITALTQAHRWVIPRFPSAYGPFLHLLIGVAVFVPALLALNFLLELHGRHRAAAER